MKTTDAVRTASAGKDPMQRLSMPAKHAHTDPAPLAVANGTLEAMKWLALVLMTLDHVNTYLFNQTVPALFALGRIAMPLFVFVLAYNLARPGAMENGAPWRIAKRLALYGAVACLPHIVLGHVYGGWWPLNILFTLLVATVVIGLIVHGGRHQSTTAVAIFILGGGLVEYWWFALGLAVANWRYCQRPNVPRLIALVTATASLWLINQKPWALAALPLILAAPYVRLSAPRSPLIFYLYYPVHLGILCLIRAQLLPA